MASQNVITTSEFINGDPAHGAIIGTPPVLPGTDPFAYVQLDSSNAADFYGALTPLTIPNVTSLTLVFLGNLDSPGPTNPGIDYGLDIIITKSAPLAENADQVAAIRNPAGSIHGGFGFYVPDDLSAYGTTSQDIRYVNGNTFETLVQALRDGAYLWLSGVTGDGDAGDTFVRVQVCYLIAESAVGEVPPRRLHPRDNRRLYPKPTARQNGSRLTGSW